MGTLFTGNNIVSYFRLFVCLFVFVFPHFKLNILFVNWQQKSQQFVFIIPTIQSDHFVFLQTSPSSQALPLPFPHPTPREKGMGGGGGGGGGDEGAEREKEMTKKKIH